MINYIYKNLTEFKLILCHSRGTKYEMLVHEMAKLDIKATHNFANAVNSVGGSIKNVDNFIEHIITTGMFSALFELIIHDVPKDKAIDYAKTLTRFYYAGWKEIMGF